MQGDKITTCDDIDYDALDPGIRETVRWLRGYGFDTCDSGDGSKAPDMECSVPFPMVAMLVDPAYLIGESHRLRGALSHEGIEAKDGDIQASYDPTSMIGMIVLSNVTISPPSIDSDVKR